MDYIITSDPPGNAIAGTYTPAGDTGDYAALFNQTAGPGILNEDWLDDGPVFQLFSGATLKAHKLVPNISARPWFGTYDNDAPNTVNFTVQPATNVYPAIPDPPGAPLPPGARPDPLNWQLINLALDQTDGDAANRAQIRIQPQDQSLILFDAQAIYNDDTGAHAWPVQNRAMPQLVFLSQRTQDYIIALPMPATMPIEIISFGLIQPSQISVVISRNFAANHYIATEMLDSQPLTLHWPTRTPRTYPPRYDRPRQARRAK